MSASIERLYHSASAAGFYRGVVRKRPTRLNHNGQKGHLIASTIRDPQGVGSVHSLTVFPPASGVMAQVVAPKMGNLMTQVLRKLR